jgi:hypothetical protein
MRAFNSLMEAIVIGLMGPIVGSIVGVVAGNLMLEYYSKWLDGLILGAAGQLDDAESQVHESRWGQQQ